VIAQAILERLYLVSGLYQFVSPPGSLVPPLVILMQPCAAKWMKNTERFVTWAGTPARCQMHSAKCSHDPGATITTAPEEAVSRMQLQLHLLPVKRWRKRKSRVKIGTCRMQNFAG